MRKNKSMTDATRLVYLEEYLNSPLTRYQFENEKGLAHRCISRWLCNFGLEDKSMAIKRPVMEINEQSASEQELREKIYSLEQQVKKLKIALKQFNMVRDAYNCMIDLAEEVYNIKVRKDSDAK